MPFAPRFEQQVRVALGDGGEGLDVTDRHARGDQPELALADRLDEGTREGRLVHRRRRRQRLLDGLAGCCVGGLPALGPARVTVVGWGTERGVQRLDYQSRVAVHDGAGTVRRLVPAARRADHDLVGGTRAGEPGAQRLAGRHVAAPNHEVGLQRRRRIAQDQVVMGDGALAGGHPDA